MAMKLLAPRDNRRRRRLSRGGGRRSRSRRDMREELSFDRQVATCAEALLGQEFGDILREGVAEQCVEACDTMLDLSQEVAELPTMAENLGSMEEEASKSESVDDIQAERFENAKAKASAMRMVADDKLREIAAEDNELTNSIAKAGLK